LNRLVKFRFARTRFPSPKGHGVCEIAD